MSRMLPMLMFASLSLGGCAPATPAPDPVAPVVTEPATPVQADAIPPQDPPKGDGKDVAAPVEDGKAAISGAIRDGNRPPPALRVCAHPVAGGAPTCIDSPQAARDYRIQVAPGRYFLLGWVQGGELQLIAHASQVRCIRAPCPPDELIEVEVAAGEDQTGIDLSGGYVDIPQGWPARP